MCSVGLAAQDRNELFLMLVGTIQNPVEAQSPPSLPYQMSGSRPRCSVPAASKPLEVDQRGLYDQ